MVTVDELQVPNVIPVIVCKLLLDQFPYCTICKQALEIHRQALVLRNSNSVVTAFHIQSKKYDCETIFKARFIKSHPKITQIDLCRILNISRRQFFKMKERQWLVV